MLKSDGEHFIDGGGELEFKDFAYVLADFDEVFFVALGEDDGFDAGALGGDDFFLDAADGEDEAAEGDFAGHGQIRADGFIQE